MNPETITGTTAIVGTTVAIFTAFMPGLTDVLQDNISQSMAHDVRYAQVAASITAIGVGGLVSYVTNSRVPVTVSVLGAIVLGIVYETTLRKEPVA